MTQFVSFRLKWFHWSKSHSQWRAKGMVTCLYNEWESHGCHIRIFTFICLSLDYYMVALTIAYIYAQCVSPQVNVQYATAPHAIFQYMDRVFNVHTEWVDYTRWSKCWIYFSRANIWPKCMDIWPYPNIAIKHTKSYVCQNGKITFVSSSNVAMLIIFFIFRFSLFFFFFYLLSKWEVTAM